MGVLLGSWQGKTVDVANSFAGKTKTNQTKTKNQHYNSRVVPFEEDENDPDIWFLDHNYLESMWSMFRKVNGKKKPPTWIIIIYFFFFVEIFFF